ncbi:MAG: FCD domain-containing protein [Deferrisomatales bacterium]|nr:FCD domain-containing protein [Deferrisomatales bacterium]
MNNRVGLDRTGSAVTTVAEEIKRWVFTGALGAGDRLPSELELAERLGVSRQSVREGLRVLELSGLLEVRRGGGGGRIVVDTIATSIGNSLQDAVQWAKITPEELTVARIELETSIAKLAAANADETDILFLRKNIEHAKTKIGRGTAAVEENIAFHRLLARASKNQILATLAEALLQVLAGALTRLPLAPGVDKSRGFTAAHEGVLAAVLERNPDAAVERMERHLREVTVRLAEPPCGVAC